MPHVTSAQSLSLRTHLLLHLSLILFNFIPTIITFIVAVTTFILISIIGIHRLSSHLRHSQVPPATMYALAILYCAPKHLRVALVHRDVLHHAECDRPMPSVSRRMAACAHTWIRRLAGMLRSQGRQYERERRCAIEHLRMIAGLGIVRGISTGRGTRHLWPFNEADIPMPALSIRILSES